MKTDLQPCGTEAAYNRHRLNKQTPCQPCREAHAAYHRAYRATQPAFVRRRANRRMNARYSALLQLSDNHPAQLDELVTELAPAGTARWRGLSAARTRLAHEHPDEFARLFAAALKREGLA